MSTARERVNEQRAAFVAGIRATTSGRWTHAKAEAAESLASKQYPVPTIEVPRIVRLGKVEYRVVNGQMEYRYLGFSRPGQVPTWRGGDRDRDTYVQLLELFDRPTETREAF